MLAVQLSDGSLEGLGRVPMREALTAARFLGGAVVSVRSWADCLDRDALERRIDGWLAVAARDESAWAHGKGWYRSARRTAQQLAKRHGTEPKRAAGVIAALSPQTSWRENLRRADDFLADPEGFDGHYRDATRKARAILNGDDPYRTLLGAGGGRKTRAFYCNIAGETRGEPVTVDRHAVCLALGSHDLDRAGRYLSTDRGYETIADAYRAVAARWGLKPHQAQAIAWVIYRAVERDIADH